MYVSLTAKPGKLFFLRDLFEVQREVDGCNLFALLVPLCGTPTSIFILP